MGVPQQGLVATGARCFQGWVQSNFFTSSICLQTGKFGLLFIIGLFCAFFRFWGVISKKFSYIPIPAGIFTTGPPAALPMMKFSEVLGHGHFHSYSKILDLEGGRMNVGQSQSLLKLALGAISATVFQMVKQNLM